MAYRGANGRMRNAGDGARQRVVDFDFDADSLETMVQAGLDALALESIKAVYSKVLQVRNEAVKLTPVDTGRLKGGWLVTKGEDALGPYVDIDNGVAYAWMVEFGTENQQASPMLRPALAIVFGVQGFQVLQIDPPGRTV